MSAGPVDEPWWCWECHGLGSWEESMEESDDPGEVECPCCGGNGGHQGEEAPPCAPATPGPDKGRTMRTAAEIASEFFVDTGETKSTNWKRLAAAIEADRAAARSAALEEAAKAVQESCPMLAAANYPCAACDRATRTIRTLALAAPGESRAAPPPSPADEGEKR